MFFSTGLVRVVLLGVLIGVGAYLLISTDLVLGLLSLSFVPFVAWRSSVTQLALRSTWLTLQERLSVLSRVMDENLGGIRVVRAFAAQRHELEKFDRAKQDALELANQRVDIRVSNTSAMNFSFFAAMGLVLWFGGEKVIAGEISVGTLAQFLTFMTILQMPVRQLGLMVNSFARASTCGTRLFELLDLDIDIKDAPGRQRPGGHRRRAALRQCRLPLRGRRRAPDAVAASRFEARPGETIGIVGPPGSGKSTIAHLIPRFYDVGSRRDHHRRAGHPQGDAADRCARPWAWCSRIRSCSRPRSRTTSPTATRGRASSASSAPPNSRSCTTTSSGFRPATTTVVGERGVSLSGGQRQRLSIARSLMLRPSVLVFDDSTAAIDAGTEQRIRTAMKRFAKDRVTLIISHRLSSLMHADQILFVENGRIVERGTHDELLALGGRYRALYDLQLRPEDDAVPAAAGAA